MGLLIAVLVLLPPRRWPLVLAVNLPVAVGSSLAHGRTLGVAVAYFAGNSLEVLAGAWLVRRAAVVASPSTVRGALALATLPALAAAGITLGASAMRAALLGGGGLSGAAWTFWGGSSLGALVVAPLLLAWAEPRRPRPLTPAVLAELAGLAAALAVAALAFSLRGSAPFAHEVVLIPPLLWAALRFGARGATAAVAIAAAAIVRVHAAQLEAGAPNGALPSIDALQFFLAVVVVTVLLVAAATEERRRAAQELARSRDLLDAFFATSPAAAFIKDDRHRAVVLSGHLAQLLGAPVASMLGRTAPETIPGPVGEEMLEMERAAVRGGASVQREITFGDRAFLDVVFPIPRAEGPPFIGGFAIEVTDRVRAEAALRERKERLRLIEAALDQASDAVSVADEDGRVVWVNAAHARMAGRPKEALVGASLLAAAPDDHGRWRRQWEETAARGPLVREQAIRGPDGRAFPGEIATAIVAFGGRRYLVSSVRDVSDRRSAEASARLAGIGTLAAGVAHEINNPLSYVLSNLAWLREHLAGGPDPAPPDEAQRVLADAHDGAERVRDVVQQLRVFACPDESAGPGDLEAAARSAIALAQNEIRHRAALVLRCSDVPPVPGSESRLAQVLLNLLMNAAQAIPAGHADRNRIVVTLRPGEASTVVAEVSDTGAGITPDVRARIFEPFFTTKPVGGGTGLGLFMCHGIVSGLGGRIEVESAPGVGSTFRVILPAAEGARPAPGAAPADARPAGAPSAGGIRAKVLVLDDDARVASAIRRVLQQDHDVDLSTDARAALERVRGGETWDVIFCDLMMPEMSGMEWFEEVSRAAPALEPRVVFMTGGAFTDAARDFLDRVSNERLQKPFVPDELRALVARRITAGRAPAGEERGEPRDR